MGFKQEQHNKGIRRFWPVIGFIMLVVLAVMAYFIAPSLQEATRDLFPQFRTAGVNREAVRLGFTFVVFVALAMFAGMVVAIMQPKKKLNIKDKDLLKMRQELLDKKEAERERMRRINRELRSRE